MLGKPPMTGPEVGLVVLHGEWSFLDQLHTGQPTKPTLKSLEIAFQIMEIKRLRVGMAGLAI